MTRVRKAGWGGLCRYAMNDEQTNPEAVAPKSRSRLTRFILAFTRTMLVLVVIVGLGGLMLNFTGKRAYEQDRAKDEAAGGTYEFVKVLPTPPPDDQNMARTPMFRAVSDYTHGKGPTTWANPAVRDRLLASELFAISKTEQKWLVRGNWEIQKVADLKVWQNYYRTNEGYVLPAALGSPAQDVLTVLAQSKQERQALLEAAQLKYAQFPLHLHADEGFQLLLPHLAFAKKLSLYLSLHGIASLANGDSASALEDLKIGYRLIGAAQNDSILISELVAAACNAILTQVIYEGLHDGKWSAAQLETIQGYLSSQDFLKGFAHSLRGERALANQTVLGWATGSPNGLPDTTGGYPLDAGLFRFVPRGWFYYNLVSLNEYYRQAIQNADAKPDVSIGQAEKRVEELLMGRGWDNWLRRMIAPALSKAGLKGRRAQATGNLAMTACALERYKMENKQYPKELSALAPKFLAAVPMDPFDGKPLSYKLEADGSFILYSIGPDQMDQGGLVVLNKPGTALDPENGDLVWSYKPL